jgi:hypothetical protein
MQDTHAVNQQWKHRRAVGRCCWKRVSRTSMHLCRFGFCCHMKGERGHVHSLRTG